MNDEPGEGGGAAGGEGGEGGQQAAAAGGEGGSALAAGDSTPLHERIPEKFRVFEGEGEEAKFNLEASAGKLLDSYGAMEKRFGDGDVPPESPDGYQIDGKELGEDFDAESFMADDVNKGFLAKCHAKGMTNAQVQMVVEHALKEFAPNLVEGSQALSQENCVSSLKSDVWKADNEYSENMTAANRLFRSLPDGLREQVDERLGNDPLFIQVAALLGKEMSEDTPVHGGQNGESQANIEELMLSEAYKNPRHPQHEATSQRVRAYFESKSGNQRVA